MNGTAHPAPEANARLYDPPAAHQAFSPGDWLRLVIGLVFLGAGLVLATVAEGTIGGIESDVAEGFSRLPDRVEESLVGAAQLLSVFVPLAVLGFVLWGRHWRLLIALLVASNVASFATLLAEHRLGQRSSSVVLAERSVSSAWYVDPNFPTTAYLASAAAVVTVVGAWMARRWKRASWTWVFVLVLLRILGSGEPAFDIVLAVAVGVVVGSLVLLVVGTPNLEPHPDELVAGLRTAGFDPVALVRADPASEAPYFAATDAAGTAAFVKVRTPDDRSSDLLNRLYRAVRLRTAEVEPPFSTLKRRVEHEALLLERSARAGVRCPDLLTLGATDGGSHFVVLERIEGRPASELGAEGLTPAVLHDLWTQIGHLHRARIAHRDPGLENVVVDDAEGRVWIVDLSDAELGAASRQMARDVAAVLVDVALEIGPERAVASAIEGLGDEAVAATLPQLQPLALAGSVRRRLRADKSVLDRLRTEIVVRTGTAEVSLDRIERISTRNLVMILAGSLAFYSLLPQFANFGDTVDSFADAHLLWIPALVAAAAVTFVFATVSFVGSVADPVPILASSRLSVASAFTKLVGPAGTGSMGLAVRFLQRAGVDTTDASASVALNSIAGVVTHLVLMFSFFAWTGRAGVGGFSLPDANTVMLVVAVILAVFAVAALLGPVRRRVLRPVVTTMRQAGAYLVRVFRSPVRVVALLGGSSMITVTNIVALIFAVEAFGGGLTAPQIGAAYLGAAAIANVAPTPGGLGALEAAMVAALTGFGLPDGQAVSAVLTFRLATFWLPILPGWAVFAWMQRKGEV